MKVLVIEMIVYNGIFESEARCPKCDNEFFEDGLIEFCGINDDESAFIFHCYDCDLDYEVKLHVSKSQ